MEIIQTHNSTKLCKTPQFSWAVVPSGGRFVGRLTDHQSVRIAAEYSTEIHGGVVVHNAADSSSS